MENKKAFVFDTNFIIQHPDLDKVQDNLKEQYSIYIAQVSIDERIAQECRDLKSCFDEAKKCEAKFSRFATIHYDKTYNDICKFYQMGIQGKYEKYFEKHIIPFSKDEGTLSTIIDRANKRLPPFSAAKDASDKGFKDCLLWLSMLSYFKANGETEILFLTDDKSAFRNNAEMLEEEFRDTTGKAIKINPNIYYNELLKKSEEPYPTPEPERATIPNLETLRANIEDTAEAIRGVNYENYFGDPQWSQTFTTSVPFDKEYTKAIFDGLESEIAEHIFEKSIPATKVLDSDGRILDGDMEIPMQSLENAFKLYQFVLDKYSQYSDQFFDAVTKILNRNYKTPPTVLCAPTDEDGNLPF